MSESIGGPTRGDASGSDAPDALASWIERLRALRSAFTAQADRIGAIDSLITLLCTHGARRAGTVVHDPVALTPRLATLCARADEVRDARVDAAEAGFYSAAGMDRESLREEFQRRTQGQRKVELGALFFSSRILRAIVTCNAALLERVTDEILDAGDWSRVEGESAASGEPGAAALSVFEAPRLRPLATAVRRRVHGDPAGDGPEARIAASLDLESLEPSEREALAGDAVATLADPIGTAILIGVLCRSLAVLSVDLQRFGIAPNDVSDLWVTELDRVFETRIDEKREQDAYRQACALAELRNKFLLGPLAKRLREERSVSHPHAPREEIGAPVTEAETGGTSDGAGTRATTSAAPFAVSLESTTATNARPARAWDLVREALEEDRRGRKSRVQAEAAAAFRWSSARLVEAAVVAMAVAAAGHLDLAGGDPDLHGLGHEQLSTVSSHLVEGVRNGRGHGPGFVGTLDGGWSSLSAAERQSAAEAMVVRLREHGLDQVMVYDRARTLRIRAIGAQPVRAL